MPLCSPTIIKLVAHNCQPRRTPRYALVCVEGLELNKLIESAKDEVPKHASFHVCGNLYRKLERLSNPPTSAKRLKRTTSPSQPPSQPPSSVGGNSNGIAVSSEEVELSSSTTTATPICPPTCDRSVRRERFNLIKEVEDLKVVLKMKEKGLMNEKESKIELENKYVDKNTNFHHRCYATAKRNNYRKAYGDLKDRLRLERTDRCLEEVLACCIESSQIKYVNSSSSISDYMKLNNDLGMQALNLLQSIKVCLDDKLLLPLKYIQHPDVLERI
jgi:hypothetical protein